MKQVLPIITLALAMGVAPALAEDTVKIGVSAPITGPVAFGGTHEIRGIETAVDAINAKGGVLGKQIELVIEDNQCNPSVSVTVANKLVEDKVVAVLGAQCSSAVLSAMPVVMDAKIPMVSGVATSPAISQGAGVGGNPWVFRLNPSDTELAIANVNYLASAGTAKTIAIVAESTDYGRGGAEAFSKAAEAKGLTIASTDFYPLGAPDFTTILTRLRSAKPDAIALFQAQADRANFVRQKQAQGVGAILTGKLNFSGQVNEELLASGAFDGAVTAFPYSPMIDTPENKAFADMMTKKYGETAQYESFAGYEEVHVLAEAIERAGSTDSSAIRDALEKTSYKSMIGGTIEFDDHNQAHNDAVISVVKDATVEIVNVFPTK